ncbi:MAG: hypothetical protein ACRDL7_16520, partial [Gaiellaceae bacterium]
IHTDHGDRVILSPEEVMNHFTRNEASTLEEINAIIDHKWDKGALLVRCTFDTGENEWIPAIIIKQDHPMTLAKYILANPVDQTRQGRWQTWSQTTLCGMC